MLKQCGTTSNGDDIILSGYQKKLKTMKKKYFVLYKETLCNAARLEYYDNEKKFKSGLSPKRIIKLQHCFNINRRLDTRYDFVITLSTRNGGFGIVLDSEEEMNVWLNKLISLQRSNLIESNLTNYDHVWQVIVQKKGLAEQKGFFGSYHVCLSNKSVTFIKICPENSPCTDKHIEILLSTIRRCGDSQCVFYMELGRQSTIGAGELWMEAEDPLIAQNMHRMILSKMSIKTDLNIEPMRKRSSSATEASKPVNILQRRSNLTYNKANISPQNSNKCIRDRCDSLPSRNRTSSECSNNNLQITSNVLSNRGLTFLRYHNNPPVVCSESEESSISIDDSEDKGLVQPYRLREKCGKDVTKKSSEIIACNTKS